MSEKLVRTVRWKMDKNQVTTLRCTIEYSSGYLFCAVRQPGVETLILVPAVDLEEIIEIEEEREVLEKIPRVTWVWEESDAPEVTYCRAPHKTNHLLRGVLRVKECWILLMERKKNGSTFVGLCEDYRIVKKQPVPRTEYHEITEADTIIPAREVLEEEGAP